MMYQTGNSKSKCQIQTVEMQRAQAGSKMHTCVSSGWASC